MMIGPVINHAHVARSSTAVQAIASSLPAEVNIHPQDKDELVAELEEKRDIWHGLGIPIPEPLGNSRCGHQ